MEAAEQIEIPTERAFATAVHSVVRCSFESWRVDMKRGKVRAVVPRVVYSKVFVGVIPACVAAGLACTGGGTANNNNRNNYGVAAVAYQCFDGSDRNCQQYGVAAVAYQCFDAGRPVPCNGDASDDAPNDAPNDGNDSG